MVQHSIDHKVGQLNDIVTSVQAEVKEITKKLTADAKKTEMGGQSELEEALRLSRQEISELKESVRAQSKLIEGLLDAIAEKPAKKPKKQVRIMSEDPIYEISVAKISEESDFVRLSQQINE